MRLVGFLFGVIIFLFSLVVILGLNIYSLGYGKVIVLVGMSRCLGLIKR